MTKQEISLDDVIRFIQTLPYKEFNRVTNHYLKHNIMDLNIQLDIMTTLNFQGRLKALGINKDCPRCKSNEIKKNGKRNYIQVFKCNDCNTKFTLFTGTILEKTKYHWDIWITVLQMVLNNFSLNEILNSLKKDFDLFAINYKTVWLWRMKLINAISLIPMPKLSGTVQIGESFIKKSQKGSRKVESSQDASSLVGSSISTGFSEYASLTTAIDDSGLCVCKVLCLGEMTKELFVDLFEDHLSNANFLCSYTNHIYDDYAKLNNIDHYEKPLQYHKIIKQKGYKDINLNCFDSAETIEKNNKKILEKLYYHGQIDKITSKKFISYEDFKSIKEKNNLSVNKIEKINSEIENFIYGDMKNVSTKYLETYIGYFIYIKNFKTKNKKKKFSKNDAEKIFIDILKGKEQLTITDIKNKQIEELKPTTRYKVIFKKHTDKRERDLSNKYFKFDKENRLKTFNKREYLLDKPKSELHLLCKELGLKNYSNFAQWSLVSLILKEPRVNEIIYKLLLEDKKYKILPKDLESVRTNSYIKY
ncbi:MAG: IS1 family transposase [Clostridium sp.]|nr:IS1 family transposase [Clostridium sp.]